jgi:DNA polymerase
MKSRLRSDGTMPFALLYFGAHTGRWTATAKVNFQNQRKKPIFVNEHGILEIDENRTDAAMEERETTGKWPEWVRHSIDLRHLIIPRPGKKMIVSDLSQIEPRVLAWLTGNTKLLDLIRDGMAIYEAHARESMGWVGGALKREDAGKYALAKARVLALGYGAGWEKFITMARTLAGLDITADDPEWIEIQDPFSGKTKQVSGWGKRSKEIVKQFRADNKPITDLWKSLDEGLKRSVGEDFSMSLPSGRKMRYEKVRCERRVEQDPETKLPRTRSVYTAQIGARRVMTYGGKLTENLVQAVARDVFGEHIVRMEDKGLNNLFGVHDEAVQEVDVEVSAEDIQREMSFCPDWLPGCPITAEAHEVEHYQK